VSRPSVSSLGVGKRFQAFTVGSGIGRGDVAALPFTVPFFAQQPPGSEPSPQPGASSPGAPRVVRLVVDSVRDAFRTMQPPPRVAWLKGRLLLATGGDLGVGSPMATAVCNDGVNRTSAEVLNKGCEVILGWVGSGGPKVQGRAPGFTGGEARCHPP
jgi:hypothetical protein